MNPLLKSAPATDEDRRIWRRVCCYGFHVHRINCCAEGMALLADRRDAELMLGAQLQPLCVVHWRSGLDHLILLRGPPVGERLEWLD